MQAGAGAIHALVKRTEQKPLLLQGELATLDASPQAILGAEESKWRSIWLRLEGKYGAPWRDWVLEEESKLPPITSQQVGAAAFLLLTRNSRRGGLDPPQGGCIVVGGGEAEVR